MTDKDTAELQTRPQHIALWLHKMASWAEICFAVFFGTFSGVIVALKWIQRNNTPWHNELEKVNYVSMIGLPFAAAAAFALVVFFRQAVGPIKIDFLGLKVVGAGGPLLLWVVCYLALAFSLWLTWGLGINPR